MCVNDCENEGEMWHETGRETSRTGAREREYRSCGVCGERMPENETYFDLFYDCLCRRCLLEIHKSDR